MTAHFTPATFAFLRALARNNRREWFEAHRDAYERDVRMPMRAIVEELDAALGTLAPEFRGDPKRSVFRIHRDVRFSKDKSPYKTNVACWLFHRDAGHGVGQEAHGGAGFYLHVEPESSMVGGGIWMPPSIALNRIRDRLDEDVASFNRVMRSPGMRRYAVNDEAVLTRVPRGYAPDHPAAAWLKYKSFTAGRALSEAQVTSRKLVAAVCDDIERLLPFVRWLNTAIGLPGAARR